MGFHQPYFSSLLANFDTFEISCYAQKSEPLIKYVTLIISLVHLWYSICKNSLQNVCRKVLKTLILQFFKIQNSAFVCLDNLNLIRCFSKYFSDFMAKDIFIKLCLQIYQGVSRLSFVWILRHFSGDICFLFTCTFRSF